MAKFLTRIIFKHFKKKEICPFFLSSTQPPLFISGATHSTVSSPKKDFEYVTEGQNQWPGLFTEWIIIPCMCVCIACINPTEQTVAGLLVLLADRAASEGL